jgi:SAM-dependent methyltransferase
MNHHQRVNLALWNEWTGVHERSSFYDLAGFRAGRCSLHATEREEVGAVEGKTLLHLQCHFELDTLSWARRGARVTGVDFSDRAIALAQSLSRELDIEGTFICSDVERLLELLTGTFEVVFTSWGVLAWLPDLGAWANVVAHFVKPTGTFYMIEQHPLLNVLDDDLQLAHSYFHDGDPMECEVQGSYADRTAVVQQRVSYQWTHSLSDVISALIGAGLRLEFLHEFPYLPYARFKNMMQGEDGWWRLPDHAPQLPLSFSLKARK